MFFSWKNMEKPTICKSKYFLLNRSKPFQWPCVRLIWAKCHRLIMSPESIHRSIDLVVESYHKVPPPLNKQYQFSLKIHRKSHLLGCSSETPRDEVSTLVIYCPATTEPPTNQDFRGPSTTVGRNFNRCLHESPHVHQLS